MSTMRLCPQQIVEILRQVAPAARQDTALSSVCRTVGIFEANLATNDTQVTNCTMVTAPTSAAEFRLRLRQMCKPLSTWFMRCNNLFVNLDQNIALACSHRTVTPLSQTLWTLFPGHMRTGRLISSQSDVRHG